MKRTFAAILAALTLFSLTGCGKTEEAPPAEQPTPPPPMEIPAPDEQPPVVEILPEPADPIDLLLDSMTLEEKVGQLFLVRVPAENAVEDVAQYHLGGYILFGRDTKDKTANEIIQTIHSYQAAACSSDGADIPLLIGVDEEGGTVARATRNPNLFPKKRKSPQTIFQNGGMEAIAEDTLTVSRGLLRYGINVNFAPVADVATDPAAFIYDRTFGQNSEATAEYIQTAVTAMEETGIGSVLKHFPGYGNNADTHTGIALDDRAYEEFIYHDSLPFRAGIAAGADSVLVSHNIVECMDDALPASLSPEVHRVLREELGFEGVALTDDLAMEAVEAYAADGSVAVLAIQAGNDMIVTTDFETQIPQVIAAVEAGEISTETIDTAVKRVLGWKYDLGLL